MSTPETSISGVILAGGMGRRMGGQDKGLLLFEGRPLIEYLLDALSPQVSHILINAVFGFFNKGLDISHSKQS